jgi:hypothetical protein
VRGTVARRIRKAAYGKGHHPKLVGYRSHPRIHGTLIADEKRQAY